MAWLQARHKKVNTADAEQGKLHRRRCADQYAYKVMVATIGHLYKKKARTCNARSYGDPKSPYTKLARRA